MDPSEYEDTIEKNEDVLDAGIVLESIFETKPKGPKFNISSDIESISATNELIYLTIFNVKDNMKKWNEVDMKNLIIILEEQAIKITELREEYVSKRKLLATSVRTFTNTHIATTNSTSTSASASESSIETIEKMRKDSKELIDEFKSNFDNLANTSKFAEASFLSIYKLLHDVTGMTIKLKTFASFLSFFLFFSLLLFNSLLFTLYSFPLSLTLSSLNSFQRSLYHIRRMFRNVCEITRIFEKLSRTITNSIKYY